MNQKYVPTLFLPSLTDNEQYINIYGVTKDEAIAFADFFLTQTEKSRKVASAPTPVTETLEFIGGNLDLESLVASESLQELVERLAKSEIRGQKGRRAVFVDIENNEIGVGTTVIYNENRAMKGVTDPSVPVTVLSAVDDAIAA